MWYYIKNNKTIGPVADSAILALFKTGEIQETTLVRMGRQSEWKRFERTRFFGRYQKKRSVHIETLALRTKVLRAFLISLMVLFAATLIFEFSRFKHFSMILNGVNFSEISLKIMRSDYDTIKSIIDAILFTVSACVLYALMRWITTVTFNTRMLDKEFRYSPSYTAWSLLIPVVNCIYPFMAIMAIYTASSRSSGRRSTIYDLVFLILFWMFNFYAIFVFTMSYWFMRYTITLDKVKALLIFNMYNVCVVVVLVAMWIIMVSKIFGFQKKSFLAAR